jgi:hypothetical protein
MKYLVIRPMERIGPNPNIGQAVSGSLLNFDAVFRPAHVSDNNHCMCNFRCGAYKERPMKELSPEERAEAEATVQGLRAEGNASFSAQQYEDALQKYTVHIRLDGDQSLIFISIAAFNCL